MIKFVDADATGLGSGDTWTDAYTDLNHAFADSADPLQGVDEIWVAEGTYKPVSQFASFTMVSGLRVYGGFTGTEADVDDRNHLANVTTLSGDFGSSDRSDHVVIFETEADVTTSLDGFTITGGRADSGSGVGDFGGAVLFNFGSGVVANCVIEGNECLIAGGGIHIESANGTVFGNPQEEVRIVSYLIRDNDSGLAGGGVCNLSGIVVIEGCVIVDNEATSRGGGVFNAGAADEPVTGEVYVINSTIADNRTLVDYVPPVGGDPGEPAGGAGLWNGETMEISNCIVWGNTSDNPDTELQQIFEGNMATSTDVVHTCIEGMSMFDIVDSGNIGIDPLFVGSGSSPYSLQAASPCINAGDEALRGVDVADLDRDARDNEITPNVDMGAIEETCPADVDLDGNVDLDDLIQIHDAFADPASGSKEDINGDGVIDIDDLLDAIDDWGICNGIGQVPQSIEDCVLQAAGAQQLIDCIEMIDTINGG